MNKDFSFYLSKFLGEYLIVERNMSPNTVKSYKKTFQLFINYLVNEKNISLNKITFKNITREIVLDFLNYLEIEKKNTIRSRNQRLACIKSFYNYCLIYEIENIENIRKITGLSSKKFTEPVFEYLSEEELQKIFESFDISQRNGLRNLLILALLYDTSARSSEILNLNISDIRLEEKYIILTGKGNKKRIVPITENTKELIIKYIKENPQNTVLFPNTTYELIRYLFKKVNKIIEGKNITPHTFRRTRATHLLDKGVNIIYIKELLGHASITTTEKYAKVITSSKFKAIEKSTPQLSNNKILNNWNDDKDLLNQLLYL